MANPIFVGRERELTRLESFLDGALRGNGQVVFVTGEAGSGKSALGRAFAERMQDRHAALIIAVGTCNAQGGIGDLTDDDITYINGDRQKLYGKLKERYGWDRMKAETEVNRRLTEFDSTYRPR